MTASTVHDDHCERRTYGKLRFYLCHCERRRRIASGVTEVPGDALEFPPPSCTSCHQYLDCDGDSWCCYGCNIAWDLDGGGGGITDTHAGSDESLRVKAEAWVARHREKS